MARPRARARGEGSIRARGSGFEARWYDASGRQRSAYGKTREIVAAKMGTALQRKRLGQGDPTAQRRLTVGSFLRDWLDKTHRLRVEPTTWMLYDGIYRTHVAPRLGHYRLTQLTPLVLQEYFAALSRILAPTTLRTHRAFLSKALNTAVKWEYLGRNPASLVELPKVEARAPTALEPAAVDALIAEVAGRWLEPLVVVTVETGLRIGEVLGLRWSAVRWQPGRLQVQQQLVRLATHGQPVIHDDRRPKSRAGYRSIPLSPRALAALQAHKRAQAARALARGAEWVRTDRIFTGQRGQPLQQATVTQALARAAKRAGIGHVTPHMLRRTFSSTTLREGGDLVAVARMMGHARVTVTLEQYRALMVGEDEATVRRLWAALGALTGDAVAEEG